MVAGFGAGKTFGAMSRAIHLKCAFPKQSVGYYLPTYDLVKKVGYEGMGELLDMMEIHSVLNKSDRTMQPRGAGSFIFRSMDSPESIVGYKHADGIVDELDTLNTENARKAWNKIIARNRQKKPGDALNTVGVATTPEGFKFVYDRWRKNPAPGYRLIKASTYSNARNLPADYIDSLKDSYTTALLLAYLDGEFCNLTAGSVYQGFDRLLNDTRLTMEPREPLHIGMDFNVTNMSAVIHIQRDGHPHAIDEIMKVFDTPAMIKSIQERYTDHPIFIYPDASGTARQSNNASTSDIKLLQEAKFTVCVNSKNPAVKDRVLSTGTMLNKDGLRRYRISQDRCPQTVEAFEKQAYDKNGEPDKSSGHDHPVDAAGYYITYRWPIKRPSAVITSLRM